jgi:hypothetical protein
MSLGAPERRFLLGALLGLHRQGEEVGPLDWERLLAFARRSGLAGITWAAASARGPQPGRAPSLELLRHEAIRDAAQTTLTLHAFARVSRLLEAAGVESMALKGVALAAVDPAYAPLRHVSDLDLLVRTSDLERVDAALTEAGARRAPGRPTLAGDTSLAALAGREVASSVANYELGGVAIDLHFRPPSPSPVLAGDPLWQRGERVEVAGATCRVPGLEDQLVILCDHVLDHHAGEPRLLPRHVSDVARLLGLGATGGDAATRPRTVGRSLALLEEARAAAEGRRRFPPGRVERAMHPAWAGPEAALRRAAARVRDRAAVLGSGGWGAVFPSRAYLAASYGVAEGAWWLPALHMRRLLWDQPMAVLGRNRGRARAPTERGRPPRNIPDRARAALRLLRLRITLPLLFRRESLPALLARLDGVGRSGEADGVEAAGVEAAAARLLRPLRFWPTTCLWRALAGYAALRASGADVRFLLGVRPGAGRPGEIEAHAWVERDGRPSIGAPGPGSGYRVAFAWPADPGTLPRVAAPNVPGLHPSEDAVLTELGDGTGVLLDLQTRFYFTLNATGVLTWKLLAGGAADVATVAAGVAARYPEADPAAVRGDVEALLADLTREGLLRESRGA